MLEPLAPLLALEIEPAFTIEQVACDVDERTQEILREADAYHDVIGYLAECWLGGEPVSVLTAIVRSGCMDRVAAVAGTKDALKHTRAEALELGLVARRHVA